MGRAALIRTVALSAVTFAGLGPPIGTILFLLLNGVSVWDIMTSPAALALFSIGGYIFAGPAALAAGVAFGFASTPWRSGRARPIRGGAVVLGMICGVIGWGLWMLAWEIFGSAGKWSVMGMFGISGVAGSLCGALLGRRWPRRLAAPAQA